MTIIYEKRYGEKEVDKIAREIFEAAIERVLPGDCFEIRLMPPANMGSHRDAGAVLMPLTPGKTARIAYSHEDVIGFNFDWAPAGGYYSAGWFVKGRQ